jgi:hypothetical protein
MTSISFKEPYPPSLGAGPSGSRSIPSASTSSAPSLKQRRVSLAVPSSARLVPAWSFRDDTKVENHVAEGSLAEGKGKMSVGTETPDGVPTTPSPDVEPPENGKKIRRKWTVEETNALVEGCKLVSRSTQPIHESRAQNMLVWSRELEGHAQGSEPKL